MSIATTLAKLKDRLATIASPTFAKIYEWPNEAGDVGSFPCAILSLSPAGQHRWAMAASGLARHEYEVAIWVLVGARAQVAIHELHARCLPWPEPIAAALYADMTLGDTVEWIGNGGSDLLLNYTIGVIEWAGKDLFGLTINLSVTEKIPMAMDA